MAEVEDGRVKVRDGVGVRGEWLGGQMSDAKSVSLTTSGLLTKATVSLPVLLSLPGRDFSSPDAFPQLGRLAAALGDGRVAVVDVSLPEADCLAPASLSQAQGRRAEAEVVSECVMPTGEGRGWSLDGGLATVVMHGSMQPHHPACRRDRTHASHHPPHPRRRSHVVQWRGPQRRPRRGILH